jgi:hypothetical protein
VTDGDDFDTTWRRASRGRQVARELEPLVAAAAAAAQQNPPDLAALKWSLERLLEFLSSERGRTDANCSVVDSYFASGDFSHLPDDYRAVVDDIGGVLHDAIHAPKIAATFESLPEQLLARVRALG